MLTENDSSEHLLAKIKSDFQISYIYHIVTYKPHRTAIHSTLKTFKFNEIKLRLPGIDVGDDLL